MRTIEAEHIAHSSVLFNIPREPRILLFPRLVQGRQDAEWGSQAKREH